MGEIGAIRGLPANSLFKPFSEEIFGVAAFTNKFFF